MDKESATLVAAVIAAAASVSKLVYDRFTESRSHHRALLQPLLTELGESVSGIVATANIMAKTKSDEAFANWYLKAKNERKKLTVVRPKLRYPLWGVDEGLRVLIRLPDWVGHARIDGERLRRLLSDADKLKSAIDRAAFNCYRAGRTPNLYEIYCVKYRAKKCRHIHDEGGKDTDETQINTPL